MSHLNMPRPMDRSLFVVLVVLLTGGFLHAAEPAAVKASPTPWKWDFDILQSREYRAGVPQAKDAFYCDKGQGSEAI